MSKASYYELLKHPKWQEKRLRIMDRANFCCERCGGREKTLNVHHGYYRKGADPWEYDDETLHCLCEDCHQFVEDHRARVYREIAPLNPDNMEYLRGVAMALHMTQQPPGDVCRPASQTALLGMVAVFSSFNTSDADSIARNAVYHGDFKGNFSALILQDAVDAEKESSEPVQMEDVHLAACSG